jgi:hypothetical protein
MSSPDSISGPLRDLAASFEACVLWAIRAIMESDVKIKTPFEVVSVVPAGSSLYCILPTGSTKYHGQLVVGIEEEDIEQLFPGEMDPRVRKDAIGEMANVISGLFVADDKFIANFGYLRPSTPFFSEGAFTARKDWGLVGRVEANGKEIAIQFSLRDLEDKASAAPRLSGGNLNREGGPD